MKKFLSVDEWMKNYSNSKLKAFYPTAIVKETDIPLQQVEVELAKYIANGILKVNLQVVCDCGHTLANNVNMSNVSLFAPLSFECFFCGHEFEIFNPKQLQKRYEFI